MGSSGWTQQSKRVVLVECVCSYKVITERIRAPDQMIRLEGNDVEVVVLTSLEQHHLQALGLIYGESWDGLIRNMN